MKIIADENMPFVREIFSIHGEVHCYPGREMNASLLKDADVLLVRSVTKVNESLINGSSVRFVGTATIGTDHVDMDYLAGRGIGFSNAAGSNANSVVEYVLSSMLLVAKKHKWDLNGKTLGIIGVGNIGKILEKKAKALGVKLLLNDPPRQRAEGGDSFVPLEQVIAESDIISCHVPLTKEGEDKTVHLIGADELAAMKKDVLLINAARGPVVDNQALKAAIKAGTITNVVLDVWETEPDIDLELLDMVTMGTPHIAGYSYDGKINGTVMLYEALCKAEGFQNILDIQKLMPLPPVPEIWLDGNLGTDQEILLQALTRIYKMTYDWKNLLESLRKPVDEAPKYFDFLRKNYPVRREATNTVVKLTNADDELAEKLTLVGFKLS